MPNVHFSFGTCLPRHSVPRARQDVKQLRHRVHKVHSLRDKEKNHSFTEVAKNPNHRKCHPREIAESVTNEHLRWIPAKTPEATMNSATAEPGTTKLGFSTESHKQKKKRFQNPNVNIS